MADLLFYPLYVASAQSFNLAANREVLLYLLIAQYPEAVDYRNRPACPLDNLFRVEVQILLMRHCQYQRRHTLNRRRQFTLHTDIYQVVLVMEKSRPRMSRRGINILLLQFIPVLDIRVVNLHLRPHLRQLSHDYLRAAVSRVPNVLTITRPAQKHLRAGYHPDSQESYDQTFDHVRNAPVLILDDFGAHSSTAWAQEKLFQIINHRFNARLPTEITTNQSLQKLDDRLYTRLSDPSLSRVYELESTSSARAGRRRLDMFEQPRFRAMTFESFDTQGLHLPAKERRKLADAYRFALDFAQKPEGWLMLTGPHGSGKTHLAVAITNYRRQAGEIPYLVGVTELLHFLRQSRETGSPLVLHQELEEIREIPLLVLDNLELRRRNPYWDELYEILSHRYDRRLPTVVTTSRTLANLSLDETGERLASLLGDPAFCSEVQLPESVPLREGLPIRRSEPSDEEPPRRSRKRAL